MPSPDVETKYYYYEGKRVAVRKGSTVYYLLSDHLGSPVSSYRASDGAMQEMRYLSYGNSRSSPGGLPTARLYTGQLQDDSSGLYQMGARWYDPTLGRFLSPDSMVPDPSNPQALNRYSYVLNNPLKYTDPTGHCVSAPWVCIGYAQQAAAFVQRVGPELYVAASDFMQAAGTFVSTYGPEVPAVLDKAAQTLGRADESSIANSDKAGEPANPTPPADMSEADSLPEFGSQFAKTPEGQAILGLRPEGPQRGFSSFQALKNAVPTGDNEVLHHIVEQSQMNSTRMGFSTEQIQNTANVVRVSGKLNQELGAFYSSIRADITGSSSITVRNWLSTQTFEAQFDFGLKAIYNVQNGIW